MIHRPVPLERVPAPSRPLRLRLRRLHAAVVAAMALAVVAAGESELIDFIEWGPRHR